MPLPTAKPNPGIEPATGANGEITEQAIRAFVKARLPRLLQHHSDVFLVEEMEVCSGRARIDIAVISDRLIGIEIKGPQDSVNRLPSQAEAYSQCFDHVVLVVHESLASKARALVPNWWGLIAGGEVDGRIRYQVERRPARNPSLNIDKVLSLLWREEIDAISLDFLGSIPSARATKKSIRAELLADVEPSLLYQASLRKLRARTEWRGVPL